MSDAERTGLHIRERTTTRTARYVVLGAAPAQARRVWFVLHGYGMLAARFVRPFDGIIPPDTCIVAPEALSRFYLESPRADGGHQQRVGAAWLTRESRETEIADAHAWLTRVYDEVMSEAQADGAPAPQVAILAFSQGVATAMRWVASAQVHPTWFVAWAGGLAHDVDREGFVSAMRDGEIVMVTGTADHFATDAARDAAQSALQSIGLEPRILSFSGGHHLDASLLQSMLESFGTPGHGTPGHGTQP